MKCAARSSTKLRDGSSHAQRHQTQEEKKMIDKMESARAQASR
jgi:hypothetical protein